MRDHEAELKEKEIEVVLVSFASPKLAQHWQAATGFTYLLLLDPERRAYAAFGLGSSVLAAWHPKMFLYYFRLLAKGRKLMRVQEDPYQLGGDFLVDNIGIIRFARASTDPMERPLLTEILAAA